MILVIKIIVIWTCFTSVFYIFKKRDGRLPIDQIGVVWLLIFSIYTSIPIVSWLIGGGAFSSMSTRLAYMRIGENENSALLNYAMAYSISFSIVYIYYAKHIKTPVLGKGAIISGAVLKSAIVVAGVALIVDVLLRSVGLIRTSDSYIDSYRAIQELPTVLRQLYKLTTSVSIVSYVIIVVSVFQRWPKYKIPFILYLGWILVTYDMSGSRFLLFMEMFSIIIAWHLLVRPIGLARAGVFAVSGILLFVALGAYRTLTLLGEGVLSDLTTGFGEFDVLWGNAIDLMRRDSSGQINLPASIMFSEFYNFVPSQLLWFDKSTLSIWYVSEYYPEYYKEGGGLAFGALSQAVVGFGIIEAVVRGCVLALVFGFTMNWLRSRVNLYWWIMPAHFYILIWTFRSVRNTTFSQMSMIIQILIPSIILIIIISKLLSANRYTLISR